MKDKHRSKRDKHKREHDASEEDKYSNILKEKYYKDEYNSKKDIKSFSKHKSPDKGRQKLDKSPARSIDQKRENHKNLRKEDMHEESYEELSRKKRRIESELQALDLEEAQAKKKKKEHRKEKEHLVKVKEEPTSDNEKSTRPPKTHNRNRPEDKPKQKEVFGKPYEEEKKVFGKPSEEAKKVEKEKPNFEVSGKLAEDTNVYNGVVIKYNEPAEARKPQRRWRLYPFKGDSDLPFIPIHRQSAYLFGRTRSIADIPIDHPSCSKQHAVLQFRLVPYTREDGTKGRRVRPYIIDLESSNGTFVNNKRIDPRCYVELIEKDVIKFGYSSREYVILHEESKNDAVDDDVNDSN